MFAFKDRFINQKNQILENFETNFEKQAAKLPQDEKNKLIALSENIQTEISKGLIIGGVISAFFYINLRTIPTFSKKKKTFLIAIPLIITPMCYYFVFMEKFRSFELYLALKAKEH